MVMSIVTVNSCFNGLWPFKLIYGLRFMVTCCMAMLIVYGYAKWYMAKCYFNGLPFMVYG